MKLHDCYEYFKEQRNIVQREIKRKKANYVNNQLQKDTKNPREPSKVFRNIGMPCKVSQQLKICLRENELFQFNRKKNANKFKDF